ncbi:uncharacterized protein LOC132737112 isoform X2 [Ruditapes philippinarum]|uniref:uncharacterized protein LOC132737112 isoform X2 n=1 Tax=Ruditapes philippinarum TaxID=129788 RepID=UPI00295AB02D|nr:uncharacterized protein LOC132737112 isoform X2 [Ruditapes philippinarum]
MLDLRLLAQYFTMAAVIISLTIILQVSYKVSAYQGLEELNALEALEESMINNGVLQHQNSVEDSDFLPTDKRYARLSYYYGNRGRGRSNRYNQNRYYKNYYTPWKNLPDNECFRQKCQTDKDCCRRYSKCDVSANICYNCWFGHPCKTSRDCCERYPYCNKSTYGGRCQN